jgi:hypothetical protein
MNEDAANETECGHRPPKGGKIMKRFDAMVGTRIAACLAGLAVAFGGAAAQQSPSHRIVPLKDIPSQRWIEAVQGDMGVAGQPFVIRIHNDAGFIVLPHTHVEDENIVVVKGIWSLGMGNEFSSAGLESVTVGDYLFVPKGTAHFAWSKTETIIQVHGTGPFVINYVDPIYVLRDQGVGLVRTEGKIEQPEEPIPSDCFPLRPGEHVRGSDGEGVVVSGQCSPGNHLTQYWVKTASGERFWARATDLMKE